MPFTLQALSAVPLSLALVALAHYVPRKGAELRW